MKVNKHILDLTKKLMAVPSTEDNPEALKKVLEIVKKELQGYYPIEEFTSNGIPSILVHNTTQRTKHFKVIFSIHVDVVPGKPEQFHPREKDGKLYGRGSYDMKAAAAVMIVLFREHAKSLPFPVGLQVSTDEEKGGQNGVKYQVGKGIRTDFAIAGECSTDMKLINKTKGIFWFTLSAQGASAHGAYPWKGENALWKLHDSLAALRELFPIPKKETWKTTINFAKIETANIVYNNVPDSAKAYIDMRFVPEDTDTMLEKIKSVLPKDIRMDILFSDPPENTPENNPYMKKLATAIEDVTNKPAIFASAHGPSDIRHFNGVGCSGVQFGLKGAGHHEDNEWVDIQSMEEYFSILKSFLHSLK